MNQSDWNDILLDTAAFPKPLDDGRFADWMRSQRVFISSVMDTELTPYRDAVRQYLQDFSAHVPVMWETLSPQDLGPKSAFLSGVDQSSLLVLILGSSYGVADESGFSPTHQEANRAAERHLPRLLFTLPADPSSRDGKMNRWIRELHIDVSGSAITRPADLVDTLDARLREFAARSERQWLKLGNCLFPGKVETQSDRQGGRAFIVTAQAYDHRVRQALLGINDPQSRQRSEVRLTWPNESYPVTIESVVQKQQFAGEADVEIRCRTPQNWYGNSGSGIGFGVVNGVGEAELCRRWIGKAFFGEGSAGNARGNDMAEMFTRPNGPTLQQVLASTAAIGWQAEGVSLIYAVEEAARTRGGRFSVLHAGPATASGVRLKGTLLIEQNGSNAKIDVDGVVSLSRQSS